MKVCVLSSGHSIDDSRVFHKEIMSLKKRYDQISLVCPLKEKQMKISGVEIFGIRPRKSRYNRFNSLVNLYKTGLSIKADIYHCHEPDSLLVGWLLKKKLGSLLVYDCHEFHPESFSENLLPGIQFIMKFTVGQYENMLSKKCDCIITVNEQLVDKFRKFNKNVYMLPNYPKLEFIPYIDFECKSPEIVYTGGLSHENGVWCAVEAVNLLKANNMDVKITFIGHFPDKKYKDKLLEFIKHNRLENNVIFTGKVKHNKALKILAEKGIGVCLIQPINIRQIYCQPIKLFEYMLAGNCIIASDFPTVRNIFKKHDCGILVDPQKPEKIAEAIKLVINNPDRLKKIMENSRKAVEHEYNWEAIEGNLLDAYEHLNECLKGMGKSI